MTTIGKELSIMARKTRSKLVRDERPAVLLTARISERERHEIRRDRKAAQRPSVKSPSNR
jgi:hypothetical protein